MRGAATDSAALKDDGLAHHKAIDGFDCKGGMLLGDCTAANAAIGTWSRPLGLPGVLGRGCLLGALTALADQIDDAA